MFYKDNIESDGLTPVSCDKIEPVTDETAAIVTLGSEQCVDEATISGDEPEKASGEPLNADEIGEAETVKNEFFAEETPPASVYGEIYGGAEITPDPSDEAELNSGESETAQNAVVRYFTAPKEKIKEIADVFGEPEETIMEEYKVFKAKKLFKKLDYFITDLPFSDENFKSRCLLADKYSMFGVTVLPTAVASAKSALAGKIAVRAIISYPYGEDLFKVKIKAIKEAVRKGADGIAVVLSSGALLGGEHKAVVKEIKSYIKAAKKRRLTVAIDSSKLSPLQTESCLAAIKNLPGVYSVAVFSSDVGGMLRLDAVKDVVKSLDKKVSVEAIGEVKTLDGAIDYFKNGVSGLTSKNGVDIAVDAENKISVKTA